MLSLCIPSETFVNWFVSVNLERKPFVVSNGSSVTNSQNTFCKLNLMCKATKAQAWSETDQTSTEQDDWTLDITKRAEVNHYKLSVQLKPCWICKWAKKHHKNYKTAFYKSRTALWAGFKKRRSTTEGNGADIQKSRVPCEVEMKWRWNTK